MYIFLSMYVCINMCSMHKVIVLILDVKLETCDIIKLIVEPLNCLE